MHCITDITSELCTSSQETLDILCSTVITKLILLIVFFKVSVTLTTSTHMAKVELLVVQDSYLYSRLWIYLPPGAEILV